MRALCVIHKKIRRIVHDICGHIQVLEKIQPAKANIQIFEAINDFARYHDGKRWRVMNSTGYLSVFISV